MMCDFVFVKYFSQWKGEVSEGLPGKFGKTQLNITMLVGFMLLF